MLRILVSPKDHELGDNAVMRFMLNEAVLDGQRLGGLL